MDNRKLVLETEKEIKGEGFTEKYEKINYEEYYLNKEEWNRKQEEIRKQKEERRIYYEKKILEENNKYAADRRYDLRLMCLWWRCHRR